MIAVEIFRHGSLANQHPMLSDFSLRPQSTSDTFTKITTETITRKMYEGISLFCIDDPCFFLVTLVTYFQIDKCQYSNHDEYDNRHC